MEKIIVQISKIAASEHLSIGALEKKIDASKGVLAKAIANNTDIQAKWVQKIAENFPQYSAEWLLTGEGEMLRGGNVQVSGSGNAVVGNSHNSTATVNATPTDTSDLRAMVEEQRTIIEGLQGQLQEKDKQIAQLLAIISNK